MQSKLQEQNISQSELIEMHIAQKFCSVPLARCFTRQLHFTPKTCEDLLLFLFTAIQSTEAAVLKG